MERGFLQAHSYNVGTSIKKEDFINGNFVPQDTFVFVGYRDQPTLQGTVIVDSGMYACVYLDSFDDEVEYAKLLLRHCNENNRTVCGDYFCEIMTEFNVLTTVDAICFCACRLPVEFNR